MKHEICQTSMFYVQYRDPIEHLAICSKIVAKDYLFFDSRLSNVNSALVCSNHSSKILGIDAMMCIFIFSYRIVNKGKT